MAPSAAPPAAAQRAPNEALRSGVRFYYEVVSRVAAK